MFSGIVDSLLNKAHPYSAKISVRILQQMWRGWVGGLEPCPLLPHTMTGTCLDRSRIMLEATRSKVVVRTGTISSSGRLSPNTSTAHQEMTSDRNCPSYCIFLETKMHVDLELNSYSLCENLQVFYRNFSIWYLIRYT